MATNKKIVKVEDTKPVKEAQTGENEGTQAAETPAQQNKPVFKPTVEAKKKATTFRVFSFVLWVLAIACEAVAIYFLIQKPAVALFGKPVSYTVWLIVFIAVDLVLTLVGSFLWRKANRLDPASEKDKARFFIQNQLGVFISVIAFLPLVILVFTNKDLDKKHKGIIGAVAVVALLAAGFGSASYNPPSVEQYTEESNTVVSLMGQDNVYWTEYGEKYHLYDDCQHINTDATAQIYEGTVAQAHEAKNITELCKTCASRAEKDHPGITDAAEEDASALTADGATGDDVADADATSGADEAA